jgi:hypothetical protein
MIKRQERSTEWISRLRRAPIHLYEKPGASGSHSLNPNKGSRLPPAAYTFGFAECGLS